MDMDLDELDQAVNKLMDQPKGRRAIARSAAPATASASPVVPVTAPVSVPSDASDTIAVKVTPPPAPEPITPAPVPTPPQPHTDEDHGSTIPVSRPMPRVPERARTHPGAMDIIQPVVSAKTAPPSARPTHVGINIQPAVAVKPVPAPVTSQPIMPAEPSPADVSDEVLASLGIDEKSKEHPAVVSQPFVPPKKEETEKWPDPLDFHGFSDKEEQKSEPAPTMQPEKSDDIPQNATPFVTTKVEKRPLGAYTATPEAPEKPAEVPAKADLAEASLQSNQHLAPAEEPDHDMNDLRQMAIPPQYQTAQNDKKEGAHHNVFDTKEYHATPQMMPGAHHKRSSPWLTVSIVVLVVLIIAAVAVGYFMMTGTFDFTKLW